MNFDQIQDLIMLLDSTGIGEFKIDDGNLKLRIRSRAYVEALQKGKIMTTTVMPVAPSTNTTLPPIAPITTLESTVPHPATQQQTTTAPFTGTQVADNLITIKSPMIGTFYRASGPNKDPFVKVGDSISIGTVLCVIEAMKLFNEIESEISGTIIKVIAEDGKSIEYDQPMFLVQP